MPQFIYTMKGLGKIYPPDQIVFQDIWLSFLYGAKIGVIGSNGSGKSTLLRIMAVLDPTKNVFGNVDEGVAPIRALLTRFDEINATFGEDMSPEEMDKLMADQ